MRIIMRRASSSYSRQKDTDHLQKENPSTHKNYFNFVSNKRNTHQSNSFTTGNIVVRVNKTLVNDTQYE